MLVLWATCFQQAISAQIIRWDRPEPYRQVFVQTDDFDSTYLTQLELGVQTAPSDSFRLLLLNDLGYYWHTRNLNQAERVTREGLRLAREKGMPVMEGRLLATLGSILLRAEQLDTAAKVLYEARERVLKADLPFVHTQLGYVMERQGLLDKAADEALKALRLGEELGDLKAIAMAYSDLSNLFWKQGRMDKALDYGLQSLTLFQKRGLRELDYDFTLYVVGNVYLSLKDYEKALNYFNRAIDMAEQYGFYNNLSDIYISLTDLHTLTGEYEQATQASLEAIRYAELLDNAFLLMRSWLSVGKLQNLQDQPARALQSLETCLQVATREFGDAFFLQQAYQELAVSYEKLGQYDKALEAYQVYDQLKSRVFTEEADRRVAELQARLDLAQKEATIDTQKRLLRQRNRLQLATAGFLVLLVILLIGLYRNFRRNKRMNERLARSNAEKELLLKEIHHRVKNNLEVVSSLLELQYARFEDPNVQDAMLLSQNRVRSMGIIHQKLYQGKDLAAIDMKDYFQDLGENLLDAFEAGDRVAIHCNMPSLELDVEAAVPVGLIVNEWITNSLKHAFPSAGPGRIDIRLHPEGDGWLALEVSDDGIGKRNGQAQPGSGFGTHLVELLTRQLGGQLSEKNGLGTSYRLIFKK